MIENQDNLFTCKYNRLDYLRLDTNIQNINPCTLMNTSMYKSMNMIYVEICTNVWETALCKN